MDDSDLPVAVPGAGGAGAPKGSGKTDSPEVPPGLNLTARERQVFEYICKSLQLAGIEHLTAGMPIAMIVRTFNDWLDASMRCTRDGRYQQSKNGWQSLQPWAEEEKRLKMELGQWLPKACLTIPSLVRVRKDTGDQSGQDDLFADLVAHGQSSPSAASVS